MPVSFQRTTTFRLFALVLVSISSAAAVAAQVTRGNPTLVLEKERPKMAAATGNNLYCAGFIQRAAISTVNRIVGAQNEADGYLSAEGDFVYINMGRDKGVSVGDMFAVVRPRGSVKSAWTDKDNIGFWVQELGALEVIRVKDTVSVARVTASCDNFLLGDLVQATERRVSPPHDPLPPLDLFADPSGKAMGRILMSRDGAEMLSRDFIAYVDLGAEDNVRVGDKLTIFRPLDDGNLMKRPQDENTTGRDYGFQSDEYKGGKFSNQSSRKSGERAQGSHVTTRQAKKGRPDLRKIVGEAVVLNVKERTATVVITRTGQEIHTGDWVEIQ
jgi:hypothetical protein